jgi:hypothetical protein
MESFLPSVYRLGEFDWWLVTDDKRAALKPIQRSALRGYDKEQNGILSRSLRMLNAYAFSQVDVDVWRNVYQSYLPPEERQRLGGFYTPDELVDLVLDLSGYVPEAAGLCERSYIDPACGSGAFVAACLSRLLAHMQRDMPCHSGEGGRRVPQWKKAEAILQRVSTNLHAVDIHPFAAFLTTLNVTFLVLPLYVLVRGRNQDFVLDLRIFSADSLEKPDT